ncbi:hypothetical protein SADO_16108 [Salinisphaera dokdonensis CL-ES53]|uniref:Diguanylate cyclase n=2 Tax=Salinisphaera TaxID=180541 RepID=A0ABV2B4I1_9GAMM
MVFAIDRESMRFVYANDGACELIGCDRHQLMTMSPHELLLTDAETLASQYDEVIEAGGITTESRSRTYDGRETIVELHRQAQLVDGRWMIVSVVNDIIKRKRAEFTRDRMSRMYASLGATNEAILRATTPDDLYEQVCEAALTGGGMLIACIMRVTADASRLTVTATAGVNGAVARDLTVPLDPSHPEGRGLVAQCFRECRQQICDDYMQDPRVAPWRNVGAKMGIRSAAAVPIVKAGETIGVMLLAADHPRAFDEEGVGLLNRMVDNVVFALENLEHEAQRKAGEKHIEFLATHDSLTHLPNRTLFNQSLSMAIESARRYRRSFALLFIDLDRFKTINDSLGHEAGDQLLIQIAERLSLAVRASDMVARIGGDEFVILVNDIQQPEDAAKLARTILSKILEPVELQGQEYRITTSIGIAIYPDDALDASSLLKHADMAMYRAKEEGKNTFEFYSAQLESRSLKRIKLENHLRQALEHDEFELAYQAKISLENEQIIGVEALLRWHSAELGEVTPTQFLPLAEEIGLIIPIGRWVLQTACEQNMAWQRQGIPPLRMAVNLSPMQFADHQLVSHLESVLERTGMPASLLELEITETAVMHDVGRALELLAQIKRLGVYISIDDFGTGYSSLTQLRDLPVDSLKIDRSFVRDLSSNITDQSIARAIITMGKNLSLNVIAEGVETAEQQSFLREQHCDDMQGYYFSRPGSHTAFADLVRSHRVRKAL